MIFMIEMRIVYGKGVKVPPFRELSCPVEKVLV
jgi:hypothetical protein